jgi:hypothetical protein
LLAQPLTRKGYAVIVDAPEVTPGPVRSDDAALKQRRFAMGIGAACLISIGAVSSWGSSAPAAVSEGMVYSSDPAPLSLLNPVDDLGMRPFERTQGRPGKVSSLQVNSSEKYSRGYLKQRAT